MWVCGKGEEWMALGKQHVQRHGGRLVDRTSLVCQEYQIQKESIGEWGPSLRKIFRDS